MGRQSRSCYFPYTIFHNGPLTAAIVRLPSVTLGPSEFFGVGCPLLCPKVLSPVVGDSLYYARFFCTFCLQEDQSDPAEELEELFEAAQRHKTAGEFERAMAGFECVLRNEMTRSELGFRALAQLYQIAMEQVLHQRLSVVFRLNPHL